MFYWCSLSLYIVYVSLTYGGISGISNFQQLDSNLVEEFPEAMIATENHLSLVNKIDKCKLCVVFLEDLKAIINGTASPVASQIMMERCENKVGNKIIFEPVCELILRELVRVIQWINGLIHPDNICILYLRIVGDNAVQRI